MVKKRARKKSSVKKKRSDIGGFSKNSMITFAMVAVIAVILVIVVLSIKSNPKELDNQTIENIDELYEEEGFSVYRDDGKGFASLYPDGWSFNEESFGVTFSSPASEGNIFIVVSRDDVGEESVLNTSEKYGKDLATTLRGNSIYTVLESEGEFWNGDKVWKVIYTERSDEGTLKILRLIIIQDAKIYEIKYGADINKYLSHLGDYNKVKNTLEIF